MSESSELISVVVICGTFEYSLELCVKSLLKQTHAEWECILVIPKSEQSSKYQSIIELSDKILIVMCDESEPAELFNKGVSCAKGDFLILLDGRHYLRADALQKLVLQLQHNKSSDLCYSSFELFSCYGDSTIVTRGVRTSGVFDVGKALYRDFLPMATLFRRNVLNKVIKFRTNISNPIWEFWVNALAHGVKAEYIGEPIVCKHGAITEWDALDSYEQLISFADVISTHPRLYPSNLASWANGLSEVLSLIKSKVSYVLVSEQPVRISSGAITSNAMHHMLKLARELKKSGQFVTLLCPASIVASINSEVPMSMGVYEGINILNLETLSPEAVLYFVGRLGRDIVLISHNSPYPLITARSSNVFFTILWCSEFDESLITDAASRIDAVVLCDKVNCEVDTLKVSSVANISLDRIVKVSNEGVILSSNPCVEPICWDIFNFQCTQREIENVTSVNLLSEKNSTKCESVVDWIIAKSNEYIFANNDCRKKHHAKIYKLQKMNINSFNFESMYDHNFSIVIPCRNVDRERLSRNLQSLRAQRNVPELEIIISDFGSNDECRDELLSLARDYQCRVVRTENNGAWSRAAALNRGIRESNAKWVVTTDADMIYRDNFFAIACEYIKECGEKSIFYAQPIKLPPLKLPNIWSPSMFDTYASRGRMFGEQGRGGCQIVLRSWLFNVRGFNEVYVVWGNEDDDMFDRAGWSGLLRVWLHPGQYLHQWHMPNIYQAAREHNRVKYQELRSAPRICVNDEMWGMEKSRTSEFNSNSSFGQKNLGSERPIQDIQREIISHESDPNIQAIMLAQHAEKALSNGQKDAALELLEDSVHLNARDARVFLLLAEVYIKMGLVEYAVVNVDRALVLDPNFEPAQKARDVLRTV